MALAGRVEGDPPVGVTDEFSSDRARPGVVPAWPGATPISFLLRVTGGSGRGGGCAVPGHDPDRERL